MIFIIKNLGFNLLIIGVIIFSLFYYNEILKKKWIDFFKKDKGLTRRIFSLIGILLILTGIILIIIKYFNNFKNIEFIKENSPIFSLVSVIIAIVAIIYAFRYNQKTKNNLDKLEKLSNYIADTTRKPLGSIIDILEQLFHLAKEAKVGGEMYYIGFTFGLGVPHFNEDNCIKWKKHCKDHTEFQDKIYEFNAHMRAKVASSHHTKSIFMILNHKKYNAKESVLNEKFFTPLFKKPEYNKIKNNIKDVTKLIENTINNLKKNDDIPKDIYEKNGLTDDIEKNILHLEIIKQIILSNKGTKDKFIKYLRTEVNKTNNQHKKDNKELINTDKYIEVIEKESVYIEQIILAKKKDKTNNNQPRKNILLEITNILNSMVVDKVNEHHNLLDRIENIPLQLFIAEIEKDDKKQYAGVIFNVGTQNIDEKPQGFYTELNDVCELFINYAKAMNEHYNKKK